MLVLILLHLKSVKSFITTILNVFLLHILFKTLLWKTISDNKCWYEKLSELSASVGRIY